MDFHITLIHIYRVISSNQSLSPSNYLHFCFYIGSFRHPGPLSPHHIRRPPNFQDVLLLSQADGSLLVRQFTLEMRSRDHTLLFPTSVPNHDGTLISLPIISPSGRLGSPPPSGRPLQMTDIAVDLVERSSIVAT